jgi:hypothetical protein
LLLARVVRLAVRRRVALPERLDALRERPEL